jgi:hypothetical protein
MGCLSVFLRDVLVDPTVENPHRRWKKKFRLTARLSALPASSSMADGVRRPLAGIPPRRVPEAARTLVARCFDHVDAAGGDAAALRSRVACVKLRIGTKLIEVQDLMEAQQVYCEQ